MIEGFTEACSFEIGFGKYKGKTIARIGSNAEGLKYLDWVVGQEWLQPITKGKIEKYLSHPSISLELERLLHEGDD